jgi:hypothetical protein
MKWLAEWEMNTTDGFIQVTHCLGINDTLWVKEETSDLTWEDVNLYNNKFTDIISKTAFDSGLYGLHLQTTSPEFTCEGNFLKYWTSEADGIHLYKFGEEGFANTGLEPYSEYISSVVSKKLFSDSIEYDLKMKHEKICSECKLFTSESEGFVPFYKILEDKSYTLSDILKICSKMGFETEFRKMILVDSVVFNQDRHLGNFGFIVDNETFKIKRFAPLFDFNVSMLTRAMNVDLDNYSKYEKEYLVGHKLGGKFAEVGCEILTKELKLPEKLTISQHPLYKMEDERFEKIKNIFESNYSKILNSQKGINITHKHKQKYLCNF